MQLFSPQIQAAFLSIAIISTPSTSFADIATGKSVNGCRDADVEIYRDNPLPSVQNPDLRKCLLKYLIISQPRLRSSEVGMPEGIRIDVTDKIIGPGIWPYCNAAPAQRRYIRALLTTTILGEENVQRAMASIITTCSIRIFRIKADTKIQFIAIYGYSEKSEEFPGEENILTTDLEDYHLTLVQTLMKGGPDEFITAANLIAKNISLSDDERK